MQVAVPVRSPHHLFPRPLRRATVGESAVSAGWAYPCIEALGSNDVGRLRQAPVYPGRLRWADRKPKVNQLRAARAGPLPGNVGEGAVSHRQLVDPKLIMQGDLVG